MSVFGLFKKQWRDYLRVLFTRPDLTIKFSANDCKSVSILSRSIVNSFPEHLLNVWDNTDFSRYLRNGFQKCGLYPFSKEIIYSSVAKALERNSEITIEQTTHYEAIRHHLEQLDLSEDVVNSHLKSIQSSVNKTEGKDIAILLKEVLVGSKPCRKRTEKDSRYSASNGEILNKSKILEKEAAKKKTGEKKAKKA